jgi:hypothetical protein
VSNNCVVSFNVDFLLCTVAKARAIRRTDNRRCG